MPARRVIKHAVNEQRKLLHQTAHGVMFPLTQLYRQKILTAR